MFVPKIPKQVPKEVRTRVALESWRVAAHRMAASGRRARIALLVITLVAAAGAACGCTPNKHTEEQSWFGCLWGSWVVASAMKAIRPFFCRATADLVAGGELHDAAEKGDLAAVKARLHSQTTSFCGRDA
jgi:hypothetical protein